MEILLTTEQIQGRIAEMGRHDELLARNGIYAKLYRIQYSREEMAAA